MAVILRAPTTDLIVRSKPLTYLAAEVASGVGTITVESITGFSVGNIIQIGVLGDERTEIIPLHASTAPSGSTITLASNLAQGHSIGAPVFVVDYNQVEFSHASTLTGAKSVLATSSIAADSIETLYTDSSNTTGFGFYRFKNSVASTYSGYFDAIPYAGYDPNTAHEIIRAALDETEMEISQRLTYTKLLSYVNGFVRLARNTSKRWSETKVLDSELATIAVGDWEVALPSDIVATFDPSAILRVAPQGYRALTYLTQEQFRNLTLDLVFTTVATTFADDATSIVLTNSSSFADSGSIIVNGDVIEYTGNTRSTNTLTGVTGIATDGHAAGSYALQRYEIGVPLYYTFSSDGNIRVWPLCGAQLENKILYIDYFKEIPFVSGLGDSILLRDTQPAIDYVAHRIKVFKAGGEGTLQDSAYQKFVQNFTRQITQDTPGQPINVRLAR